jgi:hypothetical protein
MPRLALAVVIAGFLIRLPGLTDPPLDFHPTRQYRAAIIARGYSLDLLRGLTPDRRQAIEAAVHAQARIEPPVMERLAGLVYRLIGREDLSWARAVAVVAWTLGGLALFRLASQLLSPSSALASVAIWMFLPFTIRASQSFQPDPLMAALVTSTLAAAVAYERRATGATGVLFAVALAGALVVKPMAIFFIAPPVAAVLLAGRNTVKERTRLAVLAVVAVLPALWYYATLPLASDYGPFVQLLRQPQFWRDWGLMLDRVVSWPLLLAALLGAFVAPRVTRWLLVASFAGYLAFGIVFTHHIHTHDYYSLPLVLTVALGCGALLDALARLPRGRWAALVVGAACLVAGLRAVVEARNPERRAALHAEVARYERIGELVHHSTRVLALDGSYSLPLSYYGHLLAANWPVSGDLALISLTGGTAVAAEDRLRSMNQKYFVCTIQPEFDAQPDLGAALARAHPLIARDGTPGRWNYLVYDLSRGILSAAPQQVPLFTRAGAAPAEEVVALYASAATTWTAQLPPDAPLTVTPASGTGPASLRLAAAPLAPGADRQVPLTITSNDSGSVTIDVRLRAVAGPDQPPFGAIDAPPDPITGANAPVMLQGWALDDASMRRVVVGYDDASGRFVKVGEAKRGGRRPDVAAIFPGAHDLDKASWAFALDAAILRALPRPVQLQVVAEDGAGHRAVFGRRTVQ